MTGLRFILQASIDVSGSKSMHTDKLSKELLQTKQHYEILDGLRGVAALVVVTFHFMEMVITDYSKNFAGHGFLAVDFFFCLSGFVIPYAYDNRMERMGIKEFFKSRIIRLHPLVVLGSVLGLLGFLLDPNNPGLGMYSTGKLALIFLMSVLLIPYPVVAERGFNLFNLNAPAWSLFWEYIANIVYATVLWKVGRRMLIILTILAAIPIAYIAYTSTNLMGGWSGGTFWHGGARVAYSFLAGMLVYRFNLIIRNKLGFAGITLLLLAGLLMPYIKQNWLMEAIVVLLYFPLLVALGAGAVLSDRLKKVCAFSGNISYPLYMTHYMVLWAFMNYYNKYKPGWDVLTWIIIAGIIILTGFAYVVMKWYDEPVRKYLSRKR